MNYKNEIEFEITKAYKAGVDMGASGRNGADNSYQALLKVKENLNYLASEQGINLKEYN